MQEIISQEALRDGRSYSQLILTHEANIIMF